jgi:hypothetical protein
MSGIQEILLLVAIVLGIIFLPKLTRRGGSYPPAPRLVRLNRIKLTGKLRLAIAASVFWPLVVAAYFQPWHKDLVPFIYWGIGPVAVCWSLYWVSAGYRKNR